jgi:hypothetical protein
MEFDYENADPSAPLECSTSTSGGDGDFIGDLLKLGADAASTRGGTSDGQSNDGQGQDGMAQLLGLFGTVLASGDSPEDVNISMAPLGEDGRPIESQRVGSQPRNGPPPIPHSVDLPAASGHLFVPMYQLADGVNSGQVKQRRIRCTHKGAPVLETVFRLHSGAQGQANTSAMALGTPRAEGRAPAAASPAAGASPSSADLTTDNLAQTAQNHLAAMGYDVGNTDGEVTTATVIAISQFQAERGLDVTGKVTPQLVGILAAEVDRRSSARRSNMPGAP